MKKVALLLTVFAMLGGNTVYAQNKGTQTGQAASNSASAGNGGMAWAVGLGTLAVVATVVGVAASSASSSPSTYSH